MDRDIHVLGLSSRELRPDNQILVLAGSRRSPGPTRRPCVLCSSTCSPGDATEHLVEQAVHLAQRVVEPAAPVSAHHGLYPLLSRLPRISEAGRIDPVFTVFAGSIPNLLPYQISQAPPNVIRTRLGVCISDALRSRKASTSSNTPKASAYAPISHTKESRPAGAGITTSRTPKSKERAPLSPSAHSPSISRLSLMAPAISRMPLTIAHAAMK